MKLRVTILACLSLLLLLGTVRAQALDSIPLTNIDSTVITLKEYKEYPAVVLIFTGNHCVYSKKYEVRLIEMASKYQQKGLGFMFVNSNSSTISTDDRLELMRARAIEKSYPCPYVKDETGEMAKALGASKIPQAIVGKWVDGKFVVLYSGKIDDNPLMAERVVNHYLSDAVDKILAGSGEYSETEPVGCSIKFVE